MPGPNIQGTFATGPNSSGVAHASDCCNIPTGVTSMKLTTVGLDTNNTIKTQKRTAGAAWADQTTYNSDQTATGITVAAGEEWRVQQVTQQVIKDVRYKLSCEA